MVVRGRGRGRGRLALLDGLVVAQPQEDRLAEMTAARPLLEADLADEPGLDPDNAAVALRLARQNGLRPAGRLLIDDWPQLAGSLIAQRTPNGSESSQ